MMEEFRAKNELKKIKGILLYSRGNFFQVLEVEYGRKQLLTNLFENIKNDGRHYDVIKIMEKQSSAPFFSQYDTAFKVVYKATNFKELYNFLNDEKQYNPEGYSKIAYLTQKFLSLI